MKWPVRSCVLVFSLTACSHLVSLGRAPSSIHPLSPNGTFAEIAETPDPRTEARAYIERLLVLQIRTRGWMLELDEIFEHAKGPLDLFVQPSYLKLLTAHPMSERLEHKIAVFYRQAREAAEATSASSDVSARAEKARLVVAGVYDALQNAHHNVAERVFLNHFLRVIQEERANASRKESPHPLTVPIQGEELEVAAADSEEQAKRMVADLPYTDEVKEEVENSAADLSEELNEAGLAREPQSAAVVPSVGASGNIDGTSFARGTWAITFDDGPHPLITEKDLVNLQASNTPATFFWLAKNVEVETNLVKKVQAAGFPVEDHSWSHPRLDQAEDLARLHTNLDREINQSFALDTKIYGQKPRFFRCPYGAGLRNPVIRGMIAKNGMIHVSWNVDSLDWHDANPASVQRRVEQQMAANGRGIILFHDIHTPALTVLPALVSKNAGKIRWVSIPEIVDELNGKK